MAGFGIKTNCLNERPLPVEEMSSLGGFLSDLSSYLSRRITLRKISNEEFDKRDRGLKPFISSASFKSTTFPLVVHGNWCCRGIFSIFFSICISIPFVFQVFL